MKKHLIIAAGVLLTGSAIGYAVKLGTTTGLTSPVIIEQLSSPGAYTNSSPKVTSSAAANLPSHVLLTVPFQVQAPNANWDTVHEEACEEASLIMLRHFINKTTIPSQDVAEQEIQALLKVESDNGYGVDVTVSQLKDIAKIAYDMKTGRVGKATVTKLKQELAAGRPVIVPAAGQLLPNPNFKQPGPVYHMLVLIGYDSNGFITNDPGTRNGANFAYKYEDLYFALHDWNPDNIQMGAKSYLVFD